MFRLPTSTIQVIPIKLDKYINRQIAIAPLISFRILFGGLMFFGTLRFIFSDWIDRLFIKPDFFFKFYGFSWIQVPEPFYLYLLFGVVALSALGIMIGAFYKISTTLFFLSFSYTELLDATNYLNHYYLVCILAFLLIWLPANRGFSVDAYFRPIIRKSYISAWTINVLIFQIALVYTFAGIAKLNYDWLIYGMPLAIWLPEHQDIPILGYFFQYKWTAVLFCWFGAIYDLSISWLLLFKKTRPGAYLLVIIFHVLTGLLFNIGLFPLIMISSTLIFFPADFHRKILGYLGYTPIEEPPAVSSIKTSKVFKILLPLYLLIQISLPLRYWLYPGSVLWTEEGYRFSWRVMLVEKSGQATFTVSDSNTSRKSEITNGDYLTQFQEKQMAIQPDFILQFAHFLSREYIQKHGFINPIVQVQSFVSLNGRTSRPFINPDINLAKEKISLKSKSWVLHPN